MMLFDACCLDRVFGACTVLTDMRALIFTNVSLGVMAFIAVSIIAGAALYEVFSRVQRRA
jgi:predicted transcriptional regulator